MPTGLSCQLRTYFLDTSQDGCHLRVSFIRNGCHVANGYHLIILRLDTALIDNVVVLEWLAGWFSPREPRQALPGSLDCLPLVVASPLAGLACPAREALLLPISCSSGLILALLSCMLVLDISWFFNP